MRTCLISLLFLIILVNYSCKENKTQAEILQEELLIQENQIKQQQLQLEQDRINREIELENEKQRKIEEEVQFQSTVDKEVNSYINKIFLKWGTTWTIDNYIDESARIENFEKNNEQLKFEGNFKFNRFGNIKIGRFEGIINLSNNEMMVKELCYFFESESSCI